MYIPDLCFTSANGTDLKITFMPPYENNHIICFVRTDVFFQNILLNVNQMQQMRVFIISPSF
jgi:hypothetical protein